MKPTQRKTKLKSITRQTSLYLAAILLLFVAASCNVADIKEEKPVEETPKERLITAQEMGNRESELDEAGELHNAFLDVFASEKGDETLGKFEEVVEAFYKVIENEEMKMNPSEVRIAFNEASEAAEIGGPYQPTFCETYPALCEFLDTSEPLPYEILSSDKGTSTERTLDFIGKIKADEREVLASREIEPQEREAFLAYTAVARYSAAYWHNTLRVKGNGNSWTDNGEVDVQAVDIGSVVAADVQGAKDGWQHGKDAGKGFWGKLGDSVLYAGAYSALAYIISLF